MFVKEARERQYIYICVYGLVLVIIASHLAAQVV